VSSRVRILAALGGLAALALIVWVALASGDSASEEPAVEGPGPTLVSAEALRQAAESADGAVYWAGPPEGSKLELSRSSPDRVYVRYLTGAAEAGDPRPFLTVGSYRLANPVAALHKQGKGADSVLATAPEGGVVYFSRERPESVYLAYPKSEVEIEVFAPDFQQALQLVTSGRIVPVD
jgi:hypothetical protein